MFIQGNIFNACNLQHTRRLFIDLTDLTQTDESPSGGWNQNVTTLKFHNIGQYDINDCPLCYIFICYPVHQAEGNSLNLAFSEALSTARKLYIFDKTLNRLYRMKPGNHRETTPNSPSWSYNPYGFRNLSKSLYDTASGSVYSQWLSTYFDDGDSVLNEFIYDTFVINTDGTVVELKKAQGLGTKYTNGSWEKIADGKEMIWHEDNKEWEEL